MKLVDEDGRIPAPVIGALIGGGVAGVAAIIKGLETVATAGGGVGSLVEQGLNIAFGNQDNLDDSDIAVSAALGAGMNGVSEVIEQKGKSLIKEMINSDATQKALEKEVKQNAKSTGRKTTPSSVKKKQLMIRQKK